jgi:DNA-binding SARP family transcriptional activator
MYESTDAIPIGTALSVTLLGGLEVRRYGQPLPHPFPTRRMACLFAFLLLHPGRVFSRQYLADTIWPDADPEAARASLRTALVPIRAILEPHPEDRGRFVASTHTTLCVTLPPECWVDVRAFERGLSAAERLPIDSPEWFRALEAAVELYGGDLLPDLEETWCLVRREALQQGLLSALHALTEADQARRRDARAIGWARRALSVDPCDEVSHRHLMQLHALVGKRAQAVRQYHTCCHVLRMELETTPEPETLALFRKLQAEPEREWRLSGRREPALAGRRS